MSLRDWIKRELTASFEEELTKHRDKVKDLLQLTESGDVIIKLSEATAKQRILAYLIGRVYAHFAEYTSDSAVTNKQLMEALHLPEGTVKYYLHELRNENLITSSSGVHTILVEQVGKVLREHFGGEKGT